MVKFEDMTGNNLDSKDINAEGDKLEEENTKENIEKDDKFFSKAVGEKLDDIKKETKEVLDIGEQTIETAKKSGSDNPEGIEIINETQEVTGEAMENRTDTIDTIKEIGVEGEGNFMSQFKNGEEVYNFLSKLNINQSTVDKIWESTTNEYRGKMVDMMVDYARKNNLTKDEVRRLVTIIEPSQHIGKADTYKWLTESDPVVIDSEQGLSSEGEPTAVETNVSEINVGELEGEIDEGMKKEGEGIIDEGKDAVNSLEKEADEITDKNKEIDEMVESERDNERKKWQEKDDEEKKKEIENYKEKLDGELKAEGLLREKENIEDQIEKLRKETVEFAEKTAEVAKKLQEQLEDGIDVSELEGLGQGEAREMIKEIAKNTRNNLNIAKLEWLLKEENNPEDLMDTHKDRELTIRNLQEMADGIKKLDDYLEEFERMSDEMKKEAQKEALAFVDLIIELAKDPKTIKILKAAGIITGVSILLTALGIGIPAELLAILAKNKFLVGAGAGVLGAGALTKHFLSKKENRERLKKYGKVGAGGILGAGILALGWLLDGEKWEKFIKGVSKANYPDWYYFFEGLLGLKENETGKS